MNGVNMFKKSLIAAAAVLMSTGANAGQWVDAPIISSQPVYTSFMERSPQNVCYDQQIPQYGGGATGGDVLTGMIIGGLIGKGATGNDKGAAAGAIIGGVMGADRNRPIVGYQTRRNCQVQYTYNTVDKISHYVVIADVQGQHVTLHPKVMPMGGTIRVYVNTTYTTNN